MCVQGGVIVINIEWHCNLDYSIESCLPHYSFSRLDHQDAKIAKGSNFRLLARCACINHHVRMCPRVGLMKILKQLRALAIVWVYFGNLWNLGANQHHKKWTTLKSFGDLVAG